MTAGGGGHGRNQPPNIGVITGSDHRLPAENERGCRRMADSACGRIDMWTPVSAATAGY